MVKVVSRFRDLSISIFMVLMAPISWMELRNPLTKIATALPKEGTTSFLATTLTQSEEDIWKCG